MGKHLNFSAPFT